MSAPLPFAQRYRTIVAAIATVASCDIAMGLTLQMLPLLMEKNHVPAWIMGLNAAMSPLGIMLAGPFLPRIVSRFGSKHVVYVSILLTIATLAAFKLFPSIWAWFAIRFVFGLAAGTLFTVSEAWIMSGADHGNRGRAMGLYTSVLAISFSVGPLIIPFTGIDGWLPWLIGMACVGMSAVPLAFLRISEDTFRHEEGGGGGFWAFVRRAPLLLFAVGTLTFFDAVMLSFFPIFGLRSGLPVEQVTTILGVSIIGNALLQLPIGLLADKWSRLGVILSSAIITAVLSLSLIWTIQSWLIWPVMLILGTTAYAIYTIALTILGDHFKGPDLIAGSAAFAAMWGIGGILGPPIAGAATDAFGIVSIPVTVTLIYIILLAGLVLSRGRLVQGVAHG
ncbi:MFS transporter [Nordella sp. HKS 07]|uniref:MFS transporter n=1 Tax=Nordella sp. HKS 07 TaxID=2712222 RepID=UPI0013E106CE|nr:MFS transporter [Nordella sp. HKS 07]QIG46441.1 MFS transporter [Nordella sp. HKS 07]